MDDRIYAYRHIWPILDLDRTRSDLVAEAAKQLPQILERIGAWPVSEPRIVPAADRVVCQVLVKLTPEATGLVEPAGVTDDIVRELHAQGWSDRQIGRARGVAHTTVGEIRRRLGLPRNANPVDQRQAA